MEANVFEFVMRVMAFKADNDSQHKVLSYTKRFQMFSSMRLGGRGFVLGLYLHHQAPASRLLSTSPCMLQSELAKLRKKTGYSLSICKKVILVISSEVPFQFIINLGKWWFLKTLWQHWINPFLICFPGEQALGETGNDGDAAEKWLAEQAQVHCCTAFKAAPCLVRWHWYLIFSQSHRP